MSVAYVPAIRLSDNTEGYAITPRGRAVFFNREPSLINEDFPQGTYIKRINLKYCIAPQLPMPVAPGSLIRLRTWDAYLEAVAQRNFARGNVDQGIDVYCLEEREDGSQIPIGKP
jgi:hypothetical protein